MSADGTLTSTVQLQSRRAVPGERCCCPEGEYALDDAERAGLALLLAQTELQPDVDDGTECAPPGWASLNLETEAGRLHYQPHHAVTDFLCRACAD